MVSLTGEDAGTFDITLSSRLTTRALENFTLEMYLGEGTTSASCAIGSGAEWMYIPARQARGFSTYVKLEWAF